jgi:hypothetical protein
MQRSIQFHFHNGHNEHCNRFSVFLQAADGCLREVEAGTSAVGSLDMIVLSHEAKYECHKIALRL